MFCTILDEQFVGWIVWYETSIHFIFLTVNYNENNAIMKNIV